MAMQTTARVIVEKVVLQEGLDIDAYSYLSSLGDKSPKELREMVQYHRSETLSQLKRWSRGQLIACRFDNWLEERTKTLS